MTVSLVGAALAILFVIAGIAVICWLLWQFMEWIRYRMEGGN